MSGINFINPDDIPMPDDAEVLYHKLRPVIGNKPIQKIPYGLISEFAYLWNDNPPSVKEGINDFFRECPEEFKEISIYGYHSSGGHYMFFRPSLDEIIKIGQDIIRNNDVVFVTTKACDQNGKLTDNVRETYDNMVNMQKAKTTFWVYNP